ASNTNDAPGMCLPPRTNRMAQIYFARRRAKWLTFQLRLTKENLTKDGASKPANGGVFEQA
ncbi:hypothetical protein, partial [Bordetella pseudohinzii]